jgi:hypothetical protein
LQRILTQKCKDFLEEKLENNQFVTEAQKFMKEYENKVQWLLRLNSKLIEDKKLLEEKLENNVTETQKFMEEYEFMKNKVQWLLRLKSQLIEENKLLEKENLILKQNVKVKGNIFSII